MITPCARTNPPPHALDLKRERIRLYNGDAPCQSIPVEGIVAGLSIPAMLSAALAEGHCCSDQNKV
jgi:hypothetical protein